MLLTELGEQTKVALLIINSLGVSAARNVVSLKLMISDKVSLESVTDLLNSKLPGEIRVWGLVRTLMKFDSRKFCDSRKYEYIFPSFLLDSSGCPCPDFTDATGKYIED